MNVHEMQRLSNSFNGAGGVNYSGEPVQTATDGKITDIMFDTTMDCNVQKDMESSIVYDKKLNQEETVTVSEQAGLLPSDYISMSLAAEDVAVFDEENISLDKSDISEIDKAISRVKEQRKSAKEAVSRQIEREREKEENLDEKAEIAAAKQSLLSNYLPVTPENISRLVQAADMSLPVSSLSSAHKNQLIEAGAPITPEKIEQSSCQTSYAKREEDLFHTIAGQVEKILSDAGLEVTPERLSEAKYLFENQLPVTPENIILSEKLRELETLTPEILTERIAEAMSEGYAPETADLSVISSREAAEQIEHLVSISDRELHKAFTTEVDFLRAKRQLEEIRLQMTIPAARQLAKQGIQIDVHHLTEIVDGLKKQEQEANERLLQENNVPVTEENRKQIEAVMAVKVQISQAPAAVLGKTLAQGMSQTVREFTEAARDFVENDVTVENRELVTSGKYYVGKLEDTYEKVGTEVRTDLGDSLKKAFGNVDNLLDELALPATEKNRRAVRILGYNQMDITEENIKNIKEFDTGVNQLLNRMKPEAVAELVKRKINPMDMSLEELNQVLSEIAADTEESDVSYEKYIWKMDKQGGLTKEERKSMIGIYRLLDKVEKSDGAVIGSLVRDGREITLNSLLSAVRSRMAKGMTADIDDDFGGLSEVVTEGESISDQIGAAYAGELIHTLKNHMSPAKFRQMNKNFMEMPLSELAEQGIDRTAEELSYYEESAAEVRETLANAKEAEQFLRELNMPETIENIMSAEEFLSGKNPIRKYWTKKQTDHIIENMDSEEKMAKAYETVEADLSDEIQSGKNHAEQTGEVSFTDIKLLGLMGKSVAFYRKLRERRNYEIPIATEAGITTMKVTIEKGAGEAGTVKISMNSERLGNCTGTFSIIDRRISGFVTCENAENLDQTKEWTKEIGDDLISAGFEVKELNFAIGKRRIKPAGVREENTGSTRDLYQAAKIFVQNIQRKEENYAD